MIKTTYLSKLKDIPDDCLKIFVARTLKGSISKTLEKYNCIHAPYLAPSTKLKNRYKNGEISRDDFLKTYNAEQACLPKEYSFHFENIIKKMTDCIVNQNKDVYLICYEKNPNQCHRTELASILVDMDIFGEIDYEEAIL